MKTIDFTIIIPAYNTELSLEKCLESVLSQANDISSSEILLIDDCSTDSTLDIARKIQAKHPDSIKVYQTELNSGPGQARNIGLENASGGWILFLDSDDSLAPGALSSLYDFICSNQQQNFDLVGYDWKYDENSTVKSSKGGRYDAICLQKEKMDLLKDSISLGMDGSVIYTLFRLEFLNANNLRFQSGLHEDVYFIFAAYCFAYNIGYLDMPVYIKNNRDGSIVNSISDAHIEGYFRAYGEIYNLIKNNNLLDKLCKYYYKGLIGIVATRLRDIFSNDLSQQYVSRLYHKLYHEWLKLSRLLPHGSSCRINSKYGMIANRFFELMEEKDLAENERTKAIANFIKDIRYKSWSCKDLQYSLFLGPDEIRTCCKRFFTDSGMHGDVTLVHTPAREVNLPRTIQEAKKSLYYLINRGEQTVCEGCPHLEFKEWGYITNLNVTTISFEYHSVCNLKCVYCDDRYFGGKKPEYSVSKLVKKLIADGSLRDCSSVIWGGGEPVIDKSFNELVDQVSENIPSAKHRFISNAIIFSEKINQILSCNKGSLFTSIDAGCADTYLEIRGKNKFTQVLDNLKKYAKAGARNICIKYIVLDENNSIDELRSFVNTVKRYDLLKCNFQISYNFKREHIDDSSAFAVIALYCLLRKTGVRLVYIDEFVRQKLIMTDSLYKKITSKLAAENLVDALADRKKYSKVIIWGAGEQTRNLLEHSYFFKKVKVKYIVDDTPSKVGKEYLSHKIYNSDTLHKSQEPVLISAVQNSQVMYEKYINMGLDESRLITGLVI